MCDDYPTGGLELRLLPSTALGTLLRYIFMREPPEALLKATAQNWATGRKAIVLALEPYASNMVSLDDRWQPVEEIPPDRFCRGVKHLYLINQLKWELDHAFLVSH